MYCGGTYLGAIGGTAGWVRLIKTGGAWNDNVQVVAGGSGLPIYEIYKEIEYTPDVTVDAHAADGVALSGNSVANMVIGDQVACDVDGMADDASGTYTGTPNALIEQPDHVRKHILIALLGFSGADIGASFATVGAIYAAQISGGYKFAFNLPDVATQTMDLFAAMDLQTRSNMFESGSQFQLAFNSTSDPTSQMDFDKDNIKGSFVFGKTDTPDIRNRIRGHYFRDYSMGGGQASYQKVNEKSDATSIAKYKEMQEDIEFSCIGDLSLMVDDILTWLLIQKKELKKTVKFSAFWDTSILEGCDYFTVTSTSGFWTGLKFKTLGLTPTRDELIEIQGEEFKSA